MLITHSGNESPFWDITRLTNVSCMLCAKETHPKGFLQRRVTLADTAWQYQILSYIFFHLQKTEGFLVNFSSLYFLVVFRYNLGSKKLSAWHVVDINQLLSEGIYRYNKSLRMVRFDLSII